jgi:hypothetical protein
MAAKMSQNSRPTEIGYKAVTSNEIKSANKFRWDADGSVGSVSH